MADPACPRCRPAERSATWTAGQDEGYEPRGRLSDPDLVEQRAEEFRRGGKVFPPAGEAYWDLAAGIAGRGPELAFGHIAPGGPVSQLPEPLNEVGAARFAPGVPHGPRHVRGAGLVREPHR